jgi:hypothetical protein
MKTDHLCGTKLRQYLEAAQKRKHFNNNEPIKILLYFSLILIKLILAYILS